MSVTSGFFNSLSGDRKYDAIQISSMFDGLITDGIYNGFLESFMVTASSPASMVVTVGEGRCWFNHTWTLNDAPLPLTLDVGDVVLNRIDTIVIDVDSTDTVRACTIKVVKGTPSSQAVAPSLENTETHHQYPLCDISVVAGATTVTQSNITNRRGTSDCPFVATLMTTVTVDELLVQWESQWDDWMTDRADAMDTWTAEQQEAFTTWFQTVQDTLDEDTAGNLYNLITNNTGINATATHAEGVVAITATGNPVNIVFLAPSDWAEADTYTYNGTPVELVDLLGEPVEDAWVQGSPVSLTITGGKAFFKNGGGRYKPTDLPPLNPNFTMEISEGDSEDTVTVTADKLTISPTTDMLAGGQWEYGTEMSPAPGKGQNIKHWTREQLVTSAKPFDGLYLGDVTASDAVNETILWLPENQSGSVVLSPYVVLDTNYQNGVIVTNKSGNSAWRGAWGSDVIYIGSTIESWCNATFLNSILHQSVVSQVMECTVTTTFEGDTTGKCWPLSAKELGSPTTIATDPGTTFPYFSSESHRQSYGLNYWTRTSSATRDAYFINANGNSQSTPSRDDALYYRVAFVLPKDFQIQQRPDGSYTVYNDYGLITLKDIEASSDINLVKIHVAENSGIKSVRYLSKCNLFPAFTLPLTAPIRLLADGSYDLVPEDPSLSAQTVSTLAEERSGTAVQLKNVPASTASNKVVVKIPEKSGDKDYIALRVDYDGVSGGYALMRDSSAGISAFNLSHVQGAKPYENSTLDTAAQTFEEQLTDSVKSFLVEGDVVIGTVSENATLKRKIFIASEKELGISTPSTYPEGSPFPYFATNADRILGDGANNWTRSTDMASSGRGNTCFITKTGELSSGAQNNTLQVRPIILLSGDAYVEANDDGTYTFTGEDTSSPTVSFSFTVPHGTQPVVRQYTYNYEEHYQTMLEGGVLPALGGDTGPTYSEVLAENTWAQIAQAVADKDPILDVWQVGDTKDEVIAGETLTFAIMGKNMDDLADGSGKAGLTFGMTQLMASTRQMNSWDTNSGSFAGSAMYSRLSGTIYPNLPTELKDAIKAVNKKTSSGGDFSKIRTDSMYLWLFSEIEVFGKATYSFAGEGTQYPYFATAAERIKRLSNGAGAASYWWERSPRNQISTSFCYVTPSGEANSRRASNSYGVCFGFCI